MKRRKKRILKGKYRNEDSWIEKGREGEKCTEAK